MTLPPAGDGNKTRVWDLPVRLFHWSIVALIAMLWWTGTNRLLEWHRLAGYSLLTLVLFRLIWGVAGSTTARFRHFVTGPLKTYRYVRGEMFKPGATARLGHNPVGGWSVVALLALLLVDILMGLFSVDVDGIESGPFAYLVTFDQGRIAAETHTLLFNVLLGFIAIHVLAVAFHLLFHRDNLIGPMITGRRAAPQPPPGSVQFASPARAAILLPLCTAIIWFLVQNFGQV